MKFNLSFCVQRSAGTLWKRSKSLVTESGEGLDSGSKNNHVASSGSYKSAHSAKDNNSARRKKDREKQRAVRGREKSLSRVWCRWLSTLSEKPQWWDVEGTWATTNVKPVTFCSVTHKNTNYLNQNKRKVAAGGIFQYHCLRPLTHVQNFLK